MAPRRARTIPCEKCRDKHLKCNGTVPCATCKRAGVECKPTNKSLRLKWFSASPRPTPAAPNGESDKKRPFIFIREDDTSPEAAGLEQSPSPSHGHTSPKQDTDAGLHIQFLPVPLPEEQDGYYHTTPSGSTGRVSMSFLLNEDSRSSMVVEEAPEYSHRITEADPVIDPALADETALAVSASPRTTEFSNLNSVLTDRDSYQLGLNQPHHRLDSEDSPKSDSSLCKLDTQEAYLLRCFTDKLASAFDTTDRDRHYVTVVPLRALRSPLLLNAICAASARYLMRLRDQGTSPHPGEYFGMPQPELTEETVIRYQNTSISHLMDASLHPESFSNDDVLTSITILRFHEQVDKYLTGSDHEVFTRAVQAVFQTHKCQASGFHNVATQLFLSPDIYTSSRSSLNNSASLIALRQEIWSVLLYQRPFRLPLAPIKDYPRFDDMKTADDYAWTNRILIWCAHILKLCLGDEGIDSDSELGLSKSEQWAALKSFEYDWDSRQPDCFRALYFEERDPKRGQFFPQIWQANECQVVGLQHIELGRIVLSGYDSSMQSLRLGDDLANQAREALSRKSTRIICGLGLSIDRQEALTTVAVAMSMCGKLFTDPAEREALMGIIKMLERDHAWCVNQAVDALKQACSFYPAAVDT